MNNYDKFMGKLYDILLSSNIISYDNEPKDLREKQERLEKYLNKLGRVQTKAISSGEHIETLKKLYYDKYIIKPENIPEGYFKSLEQKYLDEGYGHHNLVNPVNETDRELKEEHISAIIREQQDSLDIWIDYFFSKDSDYLPLWAKVWAFQGMLSIGNLNKDKDGYARRSNTAVNPFVSLDSEILGKCVELVKESFNSDEATDDEIDKLVASGSFQKLYGRLLANKKQLKILSSEGIWAKYNYEDGQVANTKLKNGEEPEYLKLYNSLQGYNTGWCTAGSKETAKNQICGGGSYPGGDFYVYYTKDTNNEYKVPRIAIRMNRDSIGEIRGVAGNQSIETDMESVLDEKLKEFPDGKNYQKTVNNMKMLTEIYNNYQNRELTKDELTFLYEINDKIKGFGYTTDPRIKEVKNRRNSRKDLSIIFDSSEEEIGLTEEDLYKKQLVYYQGDINDIQYKKLKKMGFTLPRGISGNLQFNFLTTAKGLKLPQTVGGDVYLGVLETAEGLILPQTVGGDFDLGCLRAAKGLIFPQAVYGSIYLVSLETAEGLTLPQTVDGSLYLSNLKTAEGLKLPQTVGGSLDLSKLTSLEDLILPQTVGGNVYLSSLANVEDLNIPQSAHGNICYRGKIYTFEKFREYLQALRESNLYHETSNNIVGRNNRHGFTTVIFMTTLVLFIVFISIIAAIMLIK